MCRSPSTQVVATERRNSNERTTKYITKQPDVNFGITISASHFHELIIYQRLMFNTQIYISVSRNLANTPKIKFFLHWKTYGFKCHFSFLLNYLSISFLPTISVKAFTSPRVPYIELICHRFVCCVSRGRFSSLPVSPALYPKFPVNSNM